MPGEIYDLLPAHIRTSDAESGEVLKALFELIGREGDLVEADIERLAETWFIETCPPWAIPYIGALLDARALHDLGPESGFSARAWVGNTIRNRKRKGTLGVVEAVSAEATGLPSRAAEMFERLSATQWMNHIRLHRNASAHIRDGDAMALTGTAFDQTPRTVEMRRIDRGSGRYNIPNIAVHLWRLQPYRIPLVETAALSDHQFVIDPLGRAVPMFWSGRTEGDVGDIAEMTDLPVPLTYRPLYRELEALRQSVAGGRTAPLVWFGGNPALSVEMQTVADGPFAHVPPVAISICDLHDTGGGAWRRPAATRDYVIESGGTETLPITIGFDPLRGRLALPEGSTAVALRASYIYAAPGDLGGGSYDRRLTDAVLLGRPAEFQVGVTKRLTPDGTSIVSTIGEAIGLWNAQPAGTAGIIALMDNDRFEEDLTGPNAAILRDGSSLAIVAADWPETDAEGGGTFRQTGTISARDRRAALVGPLEVVTEVALGAELPTNFALNGLLIDGALTLNGGAGTAFGDVSLDHIGQMPGSGGVVLTGAAIEGQLRVDRAVIGNIDLGTAEVDLIVTDSIIDGDGAAAINAIAADMKASGTTIIGTTAIGEIFANDTLFDGTIVAERTQAGCMQFCALEPAGSRTPRRYRCQPDLALEGQPVSEHDALIATLRPLFSDIRFGDPDYRRLSDRAAPELLFGASDGGSIGVWGFMQFTWRETNLHIAVDEYLPFGLKAGSVYET